LAPLNSGSGFIVLGEGSADEGGNDAASTLAGMGHDIAHEVHDPNAIDALRFGSMVAFPWPAISKPRRRRLAGPQA
jgi:hypothetical protein